MSNQILQTATKGHKTVLHTQMRNQFAVKMIVHANVKARTITHTFPFKLSNNVNCEYNHIAEPIACKM